MPIASVWPCKKHAAKCSVQYSAKECRDDLPIRKSRLSIKVSLDGLGSLCSASILDDDSFQRAKLRPQMTEVEEAMQ